MKKWYKSKTLLFNFSLLGSAMFAPFLSEDIRKYLAGIAITNIILRLKTVDKIKVK